MAARPGDGSSESLPLAGIGASFVGICAVTPRTATQKMIAANTLRFGRLRSRLIRLILRHAQLTSPTREPVRLSRILNDHGPVSTNMIFPGGAWLIFPEFQGFNAANC